MCRICEEPLESLLDSTYLDCAHCPDLVAIPPELVNLTGLDCNGCPLLASIPGTLVRLKELFCRNNPSLVSIPDTLVALEYLNCSFCPRLVTIPATLVNLIALYCVRCPLLLHIPSTLAKLTVLYGHDCPWLPCNAGSYPAHLPSLLRLQRWFRTGRKQTFKRWIRTKAFNEWIFHPGRIGGKLVKRQLEAELGAMRPAKKQWVE